MIDTLTSDAYAAVMRSLESRAEHAERLAQSLTRAPQTQAFYDGVALAFREAVNTLRHYTEGKVIP